MEWKKERLLWIFAPIIVALLFAYYFNLIGSKTYGEEESGFYKGVLLDAEIEDGCGDVIWCSTDIKLDTGWYHFGEPCHIVMNLRKNVTYVFRYEGFKNMACSGDLFWDIRICEICNSWNESIWKYSGFEG